MHKKNLLLLSSLAAWCLFSATLRADTFTETFSTNSYKDSYTTTAVWDNILGLAYLPSSYVFSQPAGLANWGGEIRAIHYQSGSCYLLGGKGAKLNLYNGGAWTNLSTSLVGGYATNNYNINSLWYNSNQWLIAGDNRSLNSYNGSSFIDQSANLSTWAASYAINAVRYGNSGTENFWLVAGNHGNLNKATYNGSSFTFTNLSGSLHYFANTENAYAIGFDTTNNYWLIGGDTGRLCRYQSNTFTYVNSLFGDNGTIDAIAAGGSNNLLIGGISGGAAKVVRYNGTSCTDLSSNLPVSFARIWTIAYNGTFWIIAGNSSGAGSPPMVVAWDGGSNWYNETASLSGFGSNVIYATEWGNSEWLLGGGQARINQRTGSVSVPAYADLAASTVDLGANPINAVSGNTRTGTVLLGGDTATLNRYNGTTFTDIAPALASIGWGTANILSICNDADNGNWLIGGTSGKLAIYNGTSATDRSSDLGFTGSITAIHWDGATWLIGGSNRQLARFNGSSFTTLDLSAIFGASETVKAISSGGGIWLIGGTSGSLALYDGVSFLSLSSGFTDIEAIGFGYYQNTYYRFVIGGATSPQRIRVYDRDLGWINWYDLSGFTGAVKTIQYNPSSQRWFIGGSAATLNEYDWEMATDRSSELINFGTAAINALDWNAEYWLLGGDVARVNKYGPIYDSPRWAQSTTVASAEIGGFYSVTLTASGTFPTGTVVKYWLTANGQKADPQVPDYWIPATPGVGVTFSGDFVGPQVKWKAELSTGDSAISPRLDEINLEYIVPFTPTPSATPTFTVTPTSTHSPTRTPTFTVTPTSTPTPTISPTYTVVVFSPTNTPTFTVTQTSTPTPTITQTSTLTPVVTATPTYTQTLTPTWTFSPTATPNPIYTYYTGSLIIPMDTSGTRANQTYGMWRAYGLVYYLLSNGIPVSWAIKSPKVYEETDFTPSQTTEKVGNPAHPAGSVYTNPAYNGGPFLVAAANSFNAMALVTLWNQGTTWNSAANPTVMVHQYTGAGFFSAPVYRILRAAPSICVYRNSEGYETGAYTYLDTAHIPDSRGNTALTWTSGTSPDALTEAQMAGLTITNHHDSSLFLTPGGLPKYSQVINMHWDPNQAYITRPNGAESIRELDTFLTYPSSHVYAQCISVATFENDWTNAAQNYGGYGHWLTTAGMNYTANPITKTAINQEVAFWPSAQATGLWTSASGAQTAFGVPTGMFYGGTSSVIQYNLSSTGDTYPYMYMSGYYHGLTGCGRVSYMCEHTSSNALPYTGNATGPAMRYFYDSLFMSPASSETVPEMFLTLTAPGQAQIGENITYATTYLNLSGIAYNVVLTLPDPTNATFVSCTGGGSHGGGSVTWNFTSLDINATGTLSVIYTLQNSGGTGWNAQSNVVYFSGPTRFTATSNPVHTSQVVYTATPTITQTRTATSTITQTCTVTPTWTPSSTMTPTRTATPTITPTGTVTQTSTITPTDTDTPICSATPTWTVTPTYTQSATYTASPTVTVTPTITPTLTATRTSTVTQTSTVTPTVTLTYTITSTLTITPTRTQTVTSTITLTRVPTWTPTPTPSPTPAITPGTIWVFPNPFSPTKASGKVMKFDNLPPASDVRIYTVSGELVRKFIGVQGRQVWDGKNEDGADVVSGIYIYTIKRSSGETQTGKLFVIR